MKVLLNVWDDHDHTAFIRTRPNKFQALRTLVDKAKAPQLPTLNERTGLLDLGEFIEMDKRVMMQTSMESDEFFAAIHLSFL